MDTSIENWSLEQYLLDSLEILRTAIDQYKQGNTPFYRVAALQLRLLLCDTTRRHGKIVDISLLSRILPDLNIPALKSDKSLDQDLHPLTLKNWLEQPIPDTEASTLSIRQFIRSLCDQNGGAHVDPKPNTNQITISNRENLIITIGQTPLK